MFNFQKKINNIRSNLVNRILQFNIVFFQYLFGLIINVFHFLILLVINLLFIFFIPIIIIKLLFFRQWKILFSFLKRKLLVRLLVISFFFVLNLIIINLYIWVFFFYIIYIIYKIKPQILKGYKVESNKFYLILLIINLILLYLITNLNTGLKIYYAYWYLK